MSQNLKNELEVAKKLAIIAGKKIIDIYDNEDFDIQEKDEGFLSPLTKADTQANEIITKELRDKFPEYSILTEEEKDDKKRLLNDFVWIIDPLDGTKEFIKKLGEFTVNIALCKNNKPILGVIYVPVTKELYYATTNNGAYYEKENKITKITVTSTAEITDMIAVRSRSHAKEKLQKILDKFKEIKISGSSIKGCIIAKGEADTYIRLGPTNEWDICAMNAIINEAGGIMTDLNGSPMKYNQDNTLNEGFIASNNKIHSKLLDLTKE